MKPRAIATDVQDGNGKWGLLLPSKGQEFHLTYKMLNRSNFLTVQQIEQFNYLNFILNPHP